MKNYPFDKQLSNEREVLDYFIAAILYRNDHKAESPSIAIHVFDMTHPLLKLSFPISTITDRLRDEFGALEAPGMPEDDNKDPEEDIDESWVRLYKLIIEAKKQDSLKTYPRS